MCSSGVVKQNKLYFTLPFSVCSSFQGSVPRLRVNGNVYEWAEKPDKGPVTLIRFTAKPGQLVKAHLRIVNEGPTVIHCDWQVRHYDFQPF